MKKHPHSASCLSMENNSWSYSYANMARIVLFAKFRMLFVVVRCCKTLISGVPNKSKNASGFPCPPVITYFSNTSPKRNALCLAGSPCSLGSCTPHAQIRCSDTPCAHSGTGQALPATRCRTTGRRTHKASPSSAPCVCSRG